jgi:predicted HNH restriction endonuclease
MRYVIITENDISEWDDKTGIQYHFPSKYRSILTEGTKIIYYKGAIKDKSFKRKRLSSNPHYFGIATLGKSYPDQNSKKRDLFILINDYQPFSLAVEFKLNDEYLEKLHIDRSNYWHDAVRKISKETYDKIVNLASVTKVVPSSGQETNDLSGDLESGEEGKSSKKYVTIYERDNRNRQQAIAIHGLSCFGCGFNFEKYYGEYAKGYIQIHHVKPVSELGGTVKINPETDLIPLCANCHAIVHRKRKQTLSLEDLKELIK